MDNSYTVRFGLDVGSTTVKCVAFDNNKVIFPITRDT